MKLDKSSEMNKRVRKLSVRLLPLVILGLLVWFGSRFVNYGDMLTRVSESENPLASTAVRLKEWGVQRTIYTALFIGAIFLIAGSKENDVKARPDKEK